MRDESEWLEVGSAEARRREIRELSAGPASERCASVLRFGLADSDWRVRKDAAEVAGKLSNVVPEVLELLIRSLAQDGDVGMRNAAIEAFSHAGSAGVDALNRALGAVERTDRKFVAAALGLCGNAGAEALTSLMRDSDPNTVLVAIEALVQVGGAVAAEAIRGHLTASERVVQLAALEALASLRALIPFCELEPLLADPILRRFAVRLATYSADLEAIPALVRLVGEACSESEQREAIRAVSRFTSANPELREALRDELRALDDAQRAMLVRWVASGDTDTASAASHLLLLSGERTSLAEVARLATRTELFPAALDALTEFGLDAVPVLLDLEAELEPEPWAWSIEVAAELAAMGHHQSTPPLWTRLHEALTRASISPEAVVSDAACRGSALLHAVHRHERGAGAHSPGADSSPIGSAAADSSDPSRRGA